MNHTSLSTGRVAVGLAGLVVGMAVGTAEAAADFSAWSDSVKILINTTDSNNVGMNVDSFPLLVRLRPDNFAHFSEVKAGGADIRFGGSKPLNAFSWAWGSLSYETEQWIDGNGDQDSAAIWVNVARIVPNDSTQYITMYFGNADAEDSSSAPGTFTGYQGTTNWVNLYGVWHLNEEAQGTGAADVYQDATAYAAHGIDNVSGSPVDGIAGKAARFNGTSDYIDIPGFTNDSLPVQLTVAAWINADVQSTWVNIIANDENGQLCDGGFALCHAMYGSEQAFRAGVSTTDGACGHTRTDYGGSFTPGTWYFVVGKYRGATIDLSLNGEFVANIDQGAFYGEGSVEASAENLIFGRQTSSYFKGMVDQVWVAAFYNGNLAEAYYRMCYRTQRPGQNVVSIAEFEPQSGVRMAPSRTRVSLARAALRNVAVGAYTRRDISPTTIYDMYGRHVGRSSEVLPRGIVVVNPGTDAR